jgi:hypothetical protein
MSKELYIACHEALIEEYLEENGLDDDHYQDAYEATADAAYGRMQDVIADRADAAWEAFRERRDGLA